MAVALATMGEDFQALLDVTIAYPRGTPTFWDLLCGRMEEVIVRVESRPIPPQLSGWRQRRRPCVPGQACRHGSPPIWEDKDRLLDALLAPAAKHGNRETAAEAV